MLVKYNITASKQIVLFIFKVLYSFLNPDYLLIRIKDKKIQQQKQSIKTNKIQRQINEIYF